MNSYETIKAIARARNAIPYRPEFKDITGSILGALILQQAITCDDIMKGEPFYKFKEPCKHDLYKQGDSWTEVLNADAMTFSRALSKLGRSVSKKKPYDPAERLLITWSTNVGRLTYYTLHKDVLEERLLAARNPHNIRD